VAATTDGCSSSRREVHGGPGCLCDVDGTLRPWPQRWPESTPLSTRSLSSHRRSSLPAALRVQLVVWSAGRRAKLRGTPRRAVQLDAASVGRIWGGLNWPNSVRTGRRMREASVKSCQHVCRCAAGNCREERDVVAALSGVARKSNRPMSPY
jgi:hypothetical protein